MAGPEDIKPEQFIAGSYTISLSIAGRNIQIGGYIRETDDKASIIAKVCRDQEVIDYMQVKANTQDEEGHLKKDYDHMEYLLDNNEQLMEKKKALRPGKTLSPQEETALRNFDVSKEALKKQIAGRKKQIEANKAVLAKYNGAAQ